MTPRSPTTPSSERPRFAGFSMKRMPSGRCHAKVTLEWRDGRTVVGEADGLASESGELRCAAEACIHALARAVHEPSFELLGVKAVRAFDATIVIVSLEADHGTRGPRLVGSHLTEQDTARGAAIAVLHATNRLLWRDRS